VEGRDTGKTVGSGEIDLGTGTFPEDHKGLMEIDGIVNNMGTIQNSVGSGSYAWKRGV